MALARTRRIDSPDAALMDLMDAVSEREQRQARRPIRPWGQPTPIKYGDYSTKSGELVVVDMTGGAFTVFLPKIQRQTLGEGIAIVNVSGSTDLLTVRPTDDATIDANAWAGIAAAWGSLRLIAVTTTKWVTI
jgi:hypothetical protein